MPDAEEIFDETGTVSGWRWTASPRKTAETQMTASADAAEKASCKVPAWLFEKAKSEPPLPRPLTPSGAYALIENDEGMENNASFSDHTEASKFALERGNATHRLLETLPDMDPQSWAGNAQTYLERIGVKWSEGQRREICRDVLAILNDKAFSQIYENASRAEVSLTGKLETARGTLLINGQIDRLVY